MKTVQNLFTFFLLIVFQLLIAFIFTSKVLAQSQIQKLDDRIMINLANNRTSEKTGLFVFLSDTYLYGDVGVPAGLLVGGIVANDKGMRQNSLYIASSTAISYAFTSLIKALVKRRRPYVQNINIVPVYRARGTSFPSGHTSSTICTATALSIAYPKWYVIAPSFLWAGSVSFSRMYLGVHYPTDVATGAILGSGTAVSMQFLKNNK